MNLWTSTGNFAVKFKELNQNSTLKTLVGIKIVNDQNFIPGDKPNLTTLIQIIALSNNGSQMYDINLRVDQPNFEEYLSIADKIIDSIH